MRPVKVGDIVYFRNDDGLLYPAFIMKVDDEETADISVLNKDVFVFIEAVKRGFGINEWHDREGSLG